MGKKRRKFHGVSWRVLRQADRAVVQYGKGTVRDAKEAAKSVAASEGRCVAQMEAGMDWVTVGVSNG